jgi:hypothetical protein
MTTIVTATGILKVFREIITAAEEVCLMITLAG